MCNSKGQLRSLRRSRNCRKVILGNSTSSKVSQVGTTDLELEVSGGRKSQVTLEEVLLVPDLRTNLLSVTCLMEDSTDLHFDSKDNVCKLVKEGEVIGEAHRHNNLWELNLIKQTREEEINQQIAIRPRMQTQSRPLG